MPKLQEITSFLEGEIKNRPVFISDEEDSTHTPSPKTVSQSMKTPTKSSPRQQTINRWEMTPEEAHREMREVITSEEAFPRELPIKKTVGKSTIMNPQQLALNHRATPLLQEYAQDG